MFLDKKSLKEVTKLHFLINITEIRNTYAHAYPDLFWNLEERFI